VTAEDLGIVHRNGIPWFDAPLPRRWHRCTVQTSGYIDGNLRERCACGAVRLGKDRPWIERNSRRKDEGQ
jgi:hypothetical protein